MFMAKYKIELLKKPTSKYNIKHVAYTLNLIEANEVLNNVFSYYSYDANDVFSAYIKYYKLNIYFCIYIIFLKRGSKHLATSLICFIFLSSFRIFS